MKGFRRGIIGPLRGPGSEGSEGSEGKVLRMDRPHGRRVLKFDGAFGPEGGGGAMGPLCGPGSEGSEGSACLWQAGSKGGGGG